MNNELTKVNENDKVEGVNTNLQVITDDGMNMILDLTAPKRQAYCSVDVANLTEDEEVDFFNAINSTEKKVGDFINKTIVVKHVYCEMVTLTDSETGEQTVAPRTVLIGEDGTGYGTCSKAVFGSLSKLFGMCGEPSTWKTPKHIEVRQVNSGAVNKCLTLALVKTPKKAK